RLVDPFGERVAEARQLAQALPLSRGGPADRGPTRIGAIPSCDDAGIVDGGSVPVDGGRGNAEGVNGISCGCSQRLIGRGGGRAIGFTARGGADGEKSDTGQNAHDILPQRWSGNKSGEK